MVPALETPPWGNQRPGVTEMRNINAHSSADKGLMAPVVGLPQAGDLQRILEHVRGRKEQLQSETRRPETPWPHPLFSWWISKPQLLRDTALWG